MRQIHPGLYLLTVVLVLIILRQWAEGADAAVAESPAEIADVSVATGTSGETRLMLNWRIFDSCFTLADTQDQRQGSEILVFAEVRRYEGGMSCQPVDESLKTMVKVGHLPAGAYDVRVESSERLLFVGRVTIDPPQAPLPTAGT